MHVDDFKGPKELARHLVDLAKDPKRYYAHFHWKQNFEVKDLDVSYELCKYANFKLPIKRRNHARISNLWDPKYVCKDVG